MVDSERKGQNAFFIWSEKKFSHNWEKVREGKELFYEKVGFQKLPNVKYGYGMVIEM